MNGPATWTARVDLAAGAIAILCDGVLLRHVHEATEARSFVADMNLAELVAWNHARMEADPEALYARGVR